MKIAGRFIAEATSSKSRQLPMLNRLNHMLEDAEDVINFKFIGGIGLRHFFEWLSDIATMSIIFTTAVAPRHIPWTSGSTMVVEEPSNSSLFAPSC
jgi:hypothetical protein